MSIRLYVRPSTKSFFSFIEIWRVGRGRWVMHDCMHYNPIQGQGHKPFKFGNSAIFQQLSPPPFTMGAGNWPRMLKLGYYIKLRLGRIFFIFGLVFVSRDFVVGTNVTCEESTVSPVRG